MNYKLTVSYDGTRYKGWQRLGGETTIQGKLEETLSRILGEPIEVSGSGRTDAGAHALGQVASFRTESRMDPAEILSRLREHLPRDIGIGSIRKADPRFHARLSAKTKTYRYRVWNSPAPCVFDERYVYRMEQPLDIAAMEQAASAFLGQHDFSAFCANKKFKKSPVRTVYGISILRQGEEVVFTFTGDGFLYNMVRILVGTLLEVGTGRRDPDSMWDILDSKAREQAGYTVPAKGLCLMEVTY